MYWQLAVRSGGNLDRAIFLRVAFFLALDYEGVCVPTSVCV